MKRILPIISLFAVAVLLGSCMKGNNQEPSPVRAGMIIYENVNGTNALALDPISTAMRFNLLMQETTDYSTANLNALKSKDNLLKLTTIASGTADEVGIFTITFTDFNVGRLGDVIIDTDGKTLFDEGGAWSVSLKDYSYTDGYGRTVKYGTTTYSLIQSATDGINIEGGFVGSYKDNEATPANWRVMATANFGENKTYEALKKTTAEVKFAINAQGKLIGSTLSGTFSNGSGYFNEPIIYKPSCQYMISSGTFMASIEGISTVNPAEFPADEVSYVWEKTSDNCGVKTTVIYNGLSQVF